MTSSLLTMIESCTSNLGSCGLAESFQSHGDMEAPSIRDAVGSQPTLLRTAPRQRRGWWFSSASTFPLISAWWFVRYLLILSLGCTALYLCSVCLAMLPADDSATSLLRYTMWYTMSMVDGAAWIITHVDLPLEVELANACFTIFETKCRAHMHTAASDIVIAMYSAAEQGRESASIQCRACWQRCRVVVAQCLCWELYPQSLSSARLQYRVAPANAGARSSV